MMKEETTYHIPVLLMPSVDAMNIRPERHVCRRNVWWRRTFAAKILSRLEDGGRLLSFDQDEDAERNIVNNPHLHSYAATSATCTTSYAITASKKWMPYLPTSAYLPITLMTANGDSPSASTGHWICV